MRVQIESRGATGGMITTSAECNTVEDLVAITKSIVTSAEAWVGDLQFVKNGLVEMFVYNFKEEVLLHFNGSPEEVDARRNPNRE